MKPKPPSDLWDEIARECEALKAPRPKPENAFTRQEFQDKRGITAGGTANKLLQKLLSAGKVQRFGHGVTTYYMLTKDVKDRGK